jgi:hypothetical protein
MEIIINVRIMNIPDYTVQVKYKYFKVNSYERRLLCNWLKFILIN